MHRYVNRRTLIAVLIVVLGGTILIPSFGFGQRRGRLGEIIRERRERRQDVTDVERARVAGLDVAVWRPSAQRGAAPLVVFSHGFTGCNTQSVFLMNALAAAGYLVVAPNHMDAQCDGRRFSRAEEPFRNPGAWNSNTYEERRRDMERLIDALRRDRTWNINWDQMALAGHSLGGYTVLGLAGAWPNWRMSGLRAVLALSPYCEPFTIRGDLGGLHVPVMYQGGTRDVGITPTVKKKGGCFEKTASPAIFVEFAGVGHFGFSDVADQQHDLIARYSVAFLDKYVRGSASANPTARAAGVTELTTK